MIVANQAEIEAKIVTNPLAKNASIKRLIGEEEGWEDYVMRIIELEAGGNSPRHEHEWEHINYVLEGEGNLMIAGKDHALTVGSYAYVPAGTLHQFTNTGEGTFRFICIVPKRGH